MGTIFTKLNWETERAHEIKLPVLWHWQWCSRTIEGPRLERKAERSEKLVTDWPVLRERAVPRRDHLASSEDGEIRGQMVRSAEFPGLCE